MLTFAVPAAAQPPEPPTPPDISAADRQAIVKEIAAELDRSYVDPDTAHKLGERLRQRLGSGAYDKMDSLHVFAGQLTLDLQEASHDLHLGVWWQPPEPPAAPGAPSEQERMAEMMRRQNYCFREVKRLPGNVGYLKLDCLVPAEMGGTTAAAAMTFLAGSDAVIFDLRDNSGGYSSLSQLLISYLLPADPPAQLTGLHRREGNRTDQAWTLAWVPGQRLLGTPVYVLVGPGTASAAEELAYDLKVLKRATIVGEKTMGAAEAARAVPVPGYPLTLSVSFGRSVNPVTGGNWEGTGVAPDVAVPAVQALTMAHSQAIAAIAEKSADPEVKRTAALVREILEGRLHPATPTAADLAAYVGTYGPGRVIQDDGALAFQQGDQPKMRLLPIGRDRFVTVDLDDRMMRFERDASGKVVRMVAVTLDGEHPIEREPEPAPPR